MYYSLFSEGWLFVGMDAEEIAELVRDLKLMRETGGAAIVLSKEEEKRGHERLERTVVGKIFARRQVNKELIKNHLPRILRSRGGMELEIIGPNLFAISFALAADKRVALEEGPWHFFQDLMIIKETNPMQSVTEIEFDEISMWIQCHNVPMACMDVGVLERIGEQVGKVEEIDLDEGGIRLGKTIRMRVVRRLEEPLIRFVPVNTEDRDVDTIVIIQYEKLPHFCFACGRVGHILKDCEDEKVDKKNLRFDHRLRAGAGAHGSGQRYYWGGGSNPRGGAGVRDVVGVSRQRVSESSASGAESERRSGGGSGKEVMVVTGGNGGVEGEGEDLGKDCMEEEEVGVEVGLGVGGTSSGGDTVEEKGRSDKALCMQPTFKGVKKGGEKWKRRAREQVSPLREDGTSGTETFLGKRGEREIDKADDYPRKRATLMAMNPITQSNPTAEVAAQPRRSQ